ncbi:MAG: helix-turn-helix transcriptional regulator [Chloroflexi bacterium]|nr:helix-turn-helix transcriptional regulator [Chloroflexota bacterium]MYD48879.1 helix-turn-helix transcriptional regulator [Chloroflexota bacterium]
MWLNAVAVWELLDLLDIAQNRLARRAGISPGHLSLLMNGMRSPAPKVRRRLMKALGVDDFHRLFTIERGDFATTFLGPTGRMLITSLATPVMETSQRKPAYRSQLALYPT